MEDQDSLEVDPNKLSEDVVNEIVEGNIVDKDEADDIGNEVWLREVNKKEPNKISFVESIGLKFREVKRSINNFTQGKIQYIENYKTIYADVVSVNPDRASEEVSLKLNHSTVGMFEVNIDPKSTNFSNLLEYKSVDNVKNLEGEKLVITRKSLESESINSILIPRNVSTIGKIRFNVYSLCREILEKTRIERLHNTHKFDIFVSYLVSGLISYFSVIFAMIALSLGTTLSLVVGSLLIIPAYVFNIVLSLHIIHFVLRSSTHIILRLVEFNNEKESEIVLS